MMAPPSLGQVELNFDGVIKGCPGNASCGGVFRDWDGNFLAAYVVAVGRTTVINTEVHRV